MLQLLFIGISSLSVGLFSIGLLEYLSQVRMPIWLGIVSFWVPCLGAGIMAWRLCGRPRYVSAGFSNPDYEKIGLLYSEEFSIRRVFEVEEYEDEGLHYFLELEDRRVLYLSGQYLYDYQEISDDPDLKQKASFPCTKFEIRRHRDERWAHSIVCQGTYLQPDIKLPHYSKLYQKSFGFPSDGDIFEIPYDDLITLIKQGNS